MANRPSIGSSGWKLRGSLWPKNRTGLTVSNHPVRMTGRRRRGNDGPPSSGPPLDAYRRRYVAQAADFGNESTADCSKDETLHRSYPIASFPFQKAPKAVCTQNLICQAHRGVSARPACGLRARAPIARCRRRVGVRRWRVWRPERPSPALRRPSARSAYLRAREAETSTFGA